MRQQGRRSALFLAVPEQRIATTGGVSRNGTEQTLELVGAVAIELRIGASRQLGDLRKESRGDTVVALLEHEHRQPEQAELARLVTDLVDLFLAAIADENHGGDS